MKFKKAAANALSLRKFFVLTTRTSLFCITPIHAIFPFARKFETQGIIWKTQFIKKDKVRWGLILSYMFRLDWDQSSNDKNFLIFISITMLKPMVIVQRTILWISSALKMCIIYQGQSLNIHIKVILCLISPTKCTRSACFSSWEYILYACSHIIRL